MIRTHKMEVPWQGQLHYKNIWIYGPPGTGKSRWSNILTSPWNIYHKNINKWWDGYQLDSHHLVLIEDWPVDKQMLGQQLKIWGDRYQFIGECKGAHLTIDPGKFFLVITSNYKPEECFLPGDVDAILRRFQVIHMESEQTIIPQLWSGVE